MFAVASFSLQQEIVPIPREFPHQTQRGADLLSKLAQPCNVPGEQVPANYIASGRPWRKKILLRQPHYPHVADT